MGISKQAFTGMLICLLLAVSAGASLADSFADFLDAQTAAYESQLSVPVSDWRFSRPDTKGEELPSFDDSKWQNVGVGFSWTGENTSVWFRTKIVIPATVAGQSVEGCPIRLDLGVDDDGELYIDGQLRERFHWDDCQYTLTEHAHAGDVYQVAVRGINGPGDGQLRKADLFFNVLPELDQLNTEVHFASLLQAELPAKKASQVAATLAASRAQIKLAAITPANLADVRAQIAAAREKLKPLAVFSKSMDVYYVGHSHIDMNWLWTWPDTIDTCHRTWNSALNLMQQFPDFHFVQSQPGAYVPIQAEYPDEFARMQEAQARGQWDLVGGFWDESDTDMPSGEALARSLSLGQSYFKAYFGKYATTAWLPDSFGHSWQLPQLFQQTGIDAFYHMRCGDGIPFTWWESPDGSKVLKANTIPYDANVQVSQLAEPQENANKYNLPLSLVVFGVGDHGGGPTREEILTAKSYQEDPILPQVHFAGIDSFFQKLAASPVASSLPMIDTDLQFVFVGCYTTHADMKKAVRSSENSLYSAEVLSSLAAMAGADYPTSSFRTAWKPTAFAQFHDIMCGSAIHSTYDWMHQQLAPAFAFEQKQTQTSLDTLANDVDTLGPSKHAIVVWNTLSYARNDIVRVAMSDAAKYHSVVDSAGHRYSAQADGGDLVFVARDVPAFGHQVYFPTLAVCRPDGVTLQETSGEDIVENKAIRITISKSTGAISKLVLKPLNWNVFGHAHDADTFQLLGDKGSAWDFNYTSADRRLLGENVQISVVGNGPVFARVRIVHRDDKSTYTQNVTVYGALDRIDIPTTVDWHEHGETLKVRLPVNATHPVVRVQIPFGNIERPTNGQECSGQKWMDLSDETPRRVTDTTPLDLTSLLNSNSTINFDTENRGYPLEKLPGSGVYQLGVRKIPFVLHTGNAGRPDNVAALGQIIKAPTHSTANTLYLLGASAPSGHSGGVELRFQDGTTLHPVVNLNDWVIGSYPDNELALQFPYRTNHGRDVTAQPKLWIAAVPISHNELREIRLPNDPDIHIFAATLATTDADTPLRGLTILNDSKYGFDANGSLFRLTALRSSNNPDPNPDEGEQNFTYSLYPHAKDWRAAHSEDQGLDLNIPLQAIVTSNHKGLGTVPVVSITNLDGRGEVIASALKHSESGSGYILRLYESQGMDTRIRIAFDRPVKVHETDILERPLHRHPLTVRRNTVTLPIGHNQIVTLRIDISLRQRKMVDSRAARQYNELKMNYNGDKRSWRWAWQSL